MGNENEIVPFLASGSLDEIGSNVGSSWFVIAKVWRMGH